MPAPVAFNTPHRIIRQALLEAKLVGRSQTPSSELFADAMNRLNDMVNFWQTQGIKLWLQTDLTISAPILQADQSLYTLGPSGDIDMTKPLRAIQGYYLESTGETRRPLQVLSQEEYNRLSVVAQTGQVNSYFVKKNQLTLDVYLWLTPDANAATGEVHVVIQSQVTNTIQLNSTMNFPSEWNLALIWGLADEFTGGQPQAVIDNCAKKAAKYKDDLENWDVEDAATTFAPDPQQMFRSSSFR
jgi:hypothetical protein